MVDHSILLSENASFSMIKLDLMGICLLFLAGRMTFLLTHSYSCISIKYRSIYWQTGRQLYWYYSSRMISTGSYVSSSTFSSTVGWQNHFRSDFIWHIPDSTCRRRKRSGIQERCWLKQNHLKYLFCTELCPLPCLSCHQNVSPCLS